jgi:SAM-dependent methyltransferase
MSAAPAQRRIMRKGADVFGRALLDWAQGGTTAEIFERDDGFTETGAGHEGYLAQFKEWPSSERQSMRFVRGRVIDVGCGAGRVALHLQERGFDVVGLDASPLAIRAARTLGLRKTWCRSINTRALSIGSFDTIVLFGNNFGMFGTPERTRRILTDWAKRTTPGARILAESTNPYCGGAPAFDRSYYRRNQQRGLLPGQARLRIQYDSSVSAWFDWLFVSRREMRMLLRGTGWHQARILGTRSSDPYVALLEKD